MVNYLNALQLEIILFGKGTALMPTEFKLLALLQNSLVKESAKSHPLSSLFKEVTLTLPFVKKENCMNQHLCFQQQEFLQECFKSYSVPKPHALSTLAESEFTRILL